MNGLSTTEELVDRHANLASRGMGSCRAAQALQKEINRRRLEAQRAFLANDNDHYNPQEHRDHGKWTAGPNVAGSPKNSPTQTQASPKSTFQLIPETPFIGTAADYMALHPGALKYSGNPYDEHGGIPTAAEIGQAFGTFGRMLSGGLADLGETVTGNPTRENFSAAINGRPMPMWDEARFLPTPLRAVEKVSQGLVESAPKIAAVATLQAAGVPAPVGAGLVFGTTEQGFDPKQAAIAAALPFLSEFGGEVSAQVAQRFGVSPGTAVNALKAAAASAAPAAGMLAEQEHEISKLPPDQQKEARMEMWINLAGMALTGIHGDEFGGNLGETGVPRERPAGEAPPKPQAAESPAAPKLPLQPLSVAEHQALEEDLQARRPISADTLERANLSGGVDIPKGYTPDVPSNRLVYTEPTPATKIPGQQTPGPDASKSATTERAPLKKGEITTYQDFDDRSEVGDGLEGHELWQHSNINEHDLATKRLSTEASKQNPVMVLDEETHKQVNAAQRSIDARSQTPTANISANAKILPKLGVADDKVAAEFEQTAKQHSEKYIKPGTHEPQ